MFQNKRHIIELTKISRNDKAEKFMKYLYGAMLLLWLAVEQIVNLNLDIYATASLLGALCLFIIKERYINNMYTSIIFLLISLLFTIHNSSFVLLIGITIVDFIYWGKYTVGFLSTTAAISAAVYTDNYQYTFHIISACLFGHVISLKDRNEKKHISLLDEERHLRYNLEQAQNALIRSQKEIEQLAEIRERNRIAHEIHDNIGHSIAGVIFQVEAAKRILKKDIDKTEGILKLCGEKLAEALELTRNTVYNIRVDRKTGVSHIEEIIHNFKFCRVSFEHTGDFNKVSASNIKIIEANIMEALTNASKYSRASNIQIKIDINKKNVRLYYKDDGIGCENIKENIGLAGMKERVRNSGGVIAIDGKDGFLIVCNLPVKNDELIGSEEL